MAASARKRKADCLFLAKMPLSARPAFEQFVLVSETSIVKSMELDGFFHVVFAQEPGYFREPVHLQGGFVIKAGCRLAVNEFASQEECEAGVNAVSTTEVQYLTVLCP